MRWAVAPLAALTFLYCVPAAQGQAPHPGEESPRVEQTAPLYDTREIVDYLGVGDESGLTREVVMDSVRTMELPGEYPLVDPLQPYEEMERMAVVLLYTMDHQEDLQLDFDDRFDLLRKGGKFGSRGPYLYDQIVDSVDRMPEILVGNGQAYTDDFMATGRRLPTLIDAVWERAGEIELFPGE